MTALYTINLRVMGSSNAPLLGVETVFEQLGSAPQRPHGGLVADRRAGRAHLVVKYALDWFLHTEFGLACRPPATTSR